MHHSATSRIQRGQWSSLFGKSTKARSLSLLLLEQVHISDTLTMFSCWREKKWASLGHSIIQLHEGSQGNQEQNQQHLQITTTSYSKVKQPFLRWTENSKLQLLLLLWQSFTCTSRNTHRHTHKCDYKSELRRLLKHPLESFTAFFSLL